MIEHLILIIFFIALFGIIANSVGALRRDVVDEEELARAKEKDGIIVDVRTSGEYKKGHIPGAVNLPVDALSEQAETVIPDKTKHIVLYCATGTRSHRAKKKLLRMGYEHVKDFGSIHKWTGKLKKG